MSQRKAWAAVAAKKRGIGLNRATASRNAETQVRIGAKAPAPFLGLCSGFGLPAPVPELRFAPPRRWRFDYAWPEAKLALEVDGGLFNQGGHVRGAHILTTHEKMNTAACMGWRVLYTTPKQLASMLPVIAQALKSECSLTWPASFPQSRAPAAVLP